MNTFSIGTPNDPRLQNWPQATTMSCNGKYLWSFAYLSNPMCCATQEIAGFGFAEQYLKLEWSEELQKVFNEFIYHPNFNRANDATRIPSLRTLVLNRHRGYPNALQPEWFVQCLEHYPGRIALDWYANANTQRASEVKPYILPRPETKL